ncbi:MAG: hypothetical protein AAB484_02445 [Patescibacteria group bacterium]
MRKIILSTLVLFLIIFIDTVAINPQKTYAETCPNQIPVQECAWIDVSNLSPAGKGYNYYNDPYSTVIPDRLCEQSDYNNYTGDAVLGEWASLGGGNYYLLWDGTKWYGQGATGSKWLSRIYCARTKRTRPTISWGPGGAGGNSDIVTIDSGAAYRIEATGSDADGDLFYVSVYRDDVEFALGGNETNKTTFTSGNNIPAGLDIGPKTVTYRASATDSGGRSTWTTSSKVVTINAPATPSGVTPSGVTPPVNKNPAGTFEATCTSLFGRVVDPDTSNESVALGFYLSGNPNNIWVAGAETYGSGNYFISTPTALKDGTNKTIYAFAQDTSGSGSINIGQATINCPTPTVITTAAPTGTIGVMPANLPAGGGNVTISWLISGMAVNAKCIASSAWSGNKDPTGQEIKNITADSTFTLSCTNSGGTLIKSASVTVAAITNTNTNTNITTNTNTNTNITTNTNTNTLSNGITYNSIPSSVITGQSFTVSVTNSGTKTWGPGHELAIRPSGGGAPVVLGRLDTTVPNGQKNVSMIAPVAGSYIVRALEQGLEDFGDSKPLTVTMAQVVNPPIVNTNIGGACTATWNNTDLPSGYVCYSGLGDLSNIGVMPASGSKQVPVNTAPYSYPCYPSSSTPQIWRTFVVHSCPVTTTTTVITNTNTGGGNSCVIGGATLTTNTINIPGGTNLGVTLSWPSTCSFVPTWESRPVGSPHTVNIAGTGGPVGVLTCGSQAPINVSAPCPSSVPIVIPNFTVNASSPVKMQTVPTVGGTSMPATISIGPVSGFASPITITATPPAGFGVFQKKEYSWNGGAFTVLPSFTIIKGINGYSPTTLVLRVSGGTVSSGDYLMSLGAVSGTLIKPPATYILRVNKTDTVFNEE